MPWITASTPMPTKRLTRSSAHVPCFLAFLRRHTPFLFAVRENLMFACKMYDPSLSQEERDGRVDEVLRGLGLESCQHTKVGHSHA